MMHQLDHPEFSIAQGFQEIQRFCVPRALPFKPVAAAAEVAFKDPVYLPAKDISYLDGHI